MDQYMKYLGPWFINVFLNLQYYKNISIFRLRMWAWPATVDTNAPSPDSLYKPTKASTAGTGRPKWTCTMPMWWIPEESASCSTKHWVCWGGGNRADWDRCQTVSWKHGARRAQQVSPSKFVGEWDGEEGKKGKWGRAGHSFSTGGEAEKGKRRWGDLKREVELRETKRTPALQIQTHRGCYRMSRLSSECRNAHARVFLWHLNPSSLTFHSAWLA